MFLKCAAFVMILALVQSCFGQDDTAFSTERSIDFFAEEIMLAVTESTASVNGTYFFRNNTGRGGAFPVMFPFFVDSLNLYPHDIQAYIIDSGNTTEVEMRRHPERGAITLRIPLKPDDTTTWHLDYNQTILGKQATYIITSTQAWGEPLEKAIYRFIVPADFDSVTVWPEADSVREVGNYIEHLSHKTYFMPDRDMKVTWKYPDHDRP